VGRHPAAAVSTPGRPLYQSEKGGVCASARTAWQPDPSEVEIPPGAGHGATARCGRGVQGRPARACLGAHRVGDDRVDHPALAALSLFFIFGLRAMLREPGGLGAIMVCCVVRRSEDFRSCLRLHVT
jgi:hypothetical protein